MSFMSYEVMALLSSTLRQSLNSLYSINNKEYNNSLSSMLIPRHHVLVKPMYTKMFWHNYLCLYILQYNFINNQHFGWLPRHHHLRVFLVVFLVEVFLKQLRIGCGNERSVATLFSFKNTYLLYTVS